MEAENSWNEAPVAGKLRLKPRIVLERNKLTPGEIQAASAGGSFSPGRPCVELEISGDVFAKGRIFEKDGKRYFQVLDDEGGQV